MLAAISIYRMQAAKRD